MRSRITATVIGAAILVGGYAAIQGGGGDPSLANLWVDQSGGTCTRQGTAATYADASACGSFDAAYEAASCGDMVRVKGGTAYPSQSIVSTQKNCSQYVTFTPADGETVTIGGAGVGTGGVAMCDADWIKFLGSRTGATSNFNVVDNGSQGQVGDFVMGSGACQFGLSERVDHIWIEGTSFEAYLIRGADQITFKNNDIAPGKSDHFGETVFVSVGYDGAYRDNYPTDLVLDGNDIHGFTSEICDPVDACHVECLTGEFENIIIRNNRVWDCGNSGGLIFSSDAGFYTKGTGNLVENNLISSQENYSLVIGSLTSAGRVTVRSNTIRRPGGGSSFVASAYSPAQFLGEISLVGNVIMDGNAVECSDMTGEPFNYNVIATGSVGCTTGGTGNVVANTTLTNPTDRAEFHLAAGQTAQDLIPTGSCPTSTDLDGEARPKGSACDAGADER